MTLYYGPDGALTSDEPLSVLAMYELKNSNRQYYGAQWFIAESMGERTAK